MVARDCIRCVYDCNNRSHRCMAMQDVPISAADMPYLKGPLESPELLVPGTPPRESPSATRRRCADEFNKLSAGAFEGSGRRGERSRAQPKGGRDPGVGHGRLALESGDMYEGQLQGGRQHGQGSTRYRDGCTYVGKWEDGLRHGFGREVMFDGPRFEGQFALDRRNGIGIYTAANGSVYQGTFRDGRIEGHGRYDFEDGHVYVGQWYGNCKSGAGRMRYPNRQVYDGQYLQDRRHGKGRLSWPSGRSYDGQWARGYQHGSGTLTEPGGVEVVGFWDRGARQSRTTVAVAAFAISPPGPSLISHQLAPPPPRVPGRPAPSLMQSEGTEVSVFSADTGEHRQSAHHCGDTEYPQDEGDDIASSGSPASSRQLAGEVPAGSSRSTENSDSATQLKPGDDLADSRTQAASRELTAELNAAASVDIDVEDAFRQEMADAQAGKPEEGPTDVNIDVQDTFGLGARVYDADAKDVAADDILWMGV